MQNFNNIPEYIKDEESLDIKDLIFKLLSRWYWFVLFGLIGLSVAYLYTKVISPTYLMNSSVIIKDENKGMSIGNIFEGLNLSDKTNVENQILMLQSYALNYETVEKMNLKISWFRKGILRDQELYGLYPYKIVLHNEIKKMGDIKINVIPLSKDKYKIRLKGSYSESNFGEGKKTKININSEDKFVEPFVCSFTKFTITRNK